ncbi:Asp-tRNA(Asn)/Glu-tRNA(Gln) amidotransferase subunit GatA [bacterium]|jgi:aspartyl-tRNA(Asn)/glutamyl-tRNA(Gln) amidotransferase subunit A|nr:Asp-tRNA(Asn)/Glu-tRNA(Gln) amidotransferase subunit GatA [bacterium]MBT4649328.1 Asp-tRNA(Asn)/Glu-tRNA(Gln) amidotransferase subunit GatA [bacterium]
MDLTVKDLAKLDISSIQAGFERGDFSSEELTKLYLQAIKDDQTNSFISINKNAIAEAKQADQKRQAGEKHALLGVPIAIKDIINTKGIQTTGASKILADYTPNFSATVVERLQEKGVVILGKTNCDEFAMGTSNEHSAYGAVLNPHDDKRVPGGSSGGSAAAVAGFLAPIALGTDTGGSIRQPASFCGVVGIKPSYGRVSRYGSMAMTSSFDQIGPITKTVKDAAILLKSMSGYDEKDATSARQPVPNYLLAIENSDPKKIKIGIPKEYFSDKLNQEIKIAIEKQVDSLKKNGFDVREVSLPNTEHSLAAYYLLMSAEVSSNLARFDGLLYGLSADSDMTLDQWYKEVRTAGFGAEAKRRIMLGSYILSAGYYDAYYKRAQKVRTLIKQDFQKVFKEVDVLLTPATPTTAFELGTKVEDPLQMYLSDIFTVGANLAGICGLVLPIGNDKDKLPIGLQLLADTFAEDKLFSLGHFIENN